MNLFVPYISGDMVLAEEVFPSGRESVECFFFFFLLGTAGSSLLTGVCFEVTW